MKPHETGTDNPIDFPSDTDLAGYENVELRLEREELYNLMLLAHSRNITLNQLVEQILVQRIEELEQGNGVENEISDQG